MAPRSIECNTFTRQIWDYMDGELPVERSAAVGLHLGGCTSCRAQLEYRQAFLDAIHAEIGSQKTPPALRERVLTALFAAAS